MGLGFLVDQIYIVSWEIMIHMQKIWGFSGFFLLTKLYWTALQNRRSFIDVLIVHWRVKICQLHCKGLPAFYWHFAEKFD